MKNVGILTMIFFAHCMLLSNCAAQSQMIKQSELLAGAAAIDITPSAPVPMSGYAARGTTSTGVHDAIIMRAFVFDDGKTKACLIQADLIGFSFLFADDVAQEIEKMGIPRQNCLLVASHNHGAPSTQVYGEELTDNLKAYLA